MPQTKITITLDLPEVCSSKPLPELQNEMRNVLQARFHIVQRMTAMQATNMEQLADKLQSDGKGESSDAVRAVSGYDRALADAIQAATLEVEVLPSPGAADEQGAQAAEQTESPEGTGSGT